jgi:FkbM family methyltransferase
MYEDVVDKAKLKLFKAVLHTRPEQLAMLVKAALRVKRRHVVAATGRTFWVDPITPFGFGVLSGKVYEPQMVALVLGLLRPTDTFIDLGANEGCFSILASSVVAQGRVLAVEPQPALREVLLENVRANAAHNVDVHSLAVSDREGEAALFVRSSINHVGSRLNRRFRLGFGSRTVRTCTLTSFCESERVDRARLLKMDCEGAEVQIVAGGQTMFARQAFDIVALEYHPQIIGSAACEKIHGQMSACGYKFASWKGQTLYYLPSARADLAAVSGEIRLDAAFT